MWCAFNEIEGEICPVMFLLLTNLSSNRIYHCNQYSVW